MRNYSLHIVFLVLFACHSASAGQHSLLNWTFTTDGAGWTAAHDCTATAQDGMLRVKSVGPDPFLHGPAISVASPAVVRIRMRIQTAGQARLYWRTMRPSLVQSDWGEEAVVYFDVKHDGDWHEYNIPVDMDATITQLRIDPGKAPGTADIEWIEIDKLEDSAEDSAGPNTGLPSSVRISDGPISLSLETRSRRIAVTDARTHRTWESARPNGVGYTSVRRLAKSSLSLGIIEMASGLKATCRVVVDKSGRVSFNLTGENSTRFSRLSFPPRIETEFKNGALVFTQRSCGQLVDQKATDYPARSLMCYGNLGLDMPWFGVTDLIRGDGLMLLIETPTDAMVDLIPDAKGRLWPQIRWIPTKDHWGYSRAVSYRFVASGGYVALAKMYRNYARQTGLLKTLAQKAKSRPNVSRLRGSPSIWGITTSDKERPGPPPQFAKEARAFGIKRAIMNIAMDVPSPDIAAINKLGYLTGEYDNYDDLREGPNGITTGPVQADTIRLADGKLARGWINEDGSQMYRRASSVAVAVAQEVVPAILKTRPFTARFLDVTSAVDLMEDYNPNHPYDRRGDLRNRLALYNYIASQGLVVGGEHGKAWGVPVLDYAEGKLSGSFWWEMPAGYLKVPKSREDIKQNYLRYGANYRVRIPLWELVFHDCVVSAWYWGDSSGYYTEVAPEMDEFQDLSTMLYGGIPLYWVNHLGYGWNRHRARMLESYGNTCKLHEAIGFDEMKSHEFLTKDRSVQRTRFSSGATVVVNYGDKPYNCKDAGRSITLAPKGFVAHGPGIEQERVWKNGAVVTTVTAPDFVSCQATAMRTVGPFKVEGRAAAFKMDSRNWHILLDSSKSCTIDLRDIAGKDAARRGRLFRTDDQGEPTAEAVDQPINGRVIVKGGVGLRLYAYKW